MSELFADMQSKGLASYQRLPFKMAGKAKAVFDWLKIITTTKVYRIDSEEETPEAS